MLVDRALVERLEHVEAVTTAHLVDALVATGSRDPVPVAVPLAGGVLVLTGPARYVNRAVGSTLGPLSADDLALVVDRSAAAGVPAAVQLSSWAPEATTAALREAGFAPVWCRSVLAVPLTSGPVTVGAPPGDALRAGAPPGDAVPGDAAREDGVTAGAPPADRVEVVAVGDDPGLAAAAADVMVAEALADGGDRSTSDEFMAADRVCRGTTQLLALLDGRPVGCGSLTVVEDEGTTTGWLGAAATVPSARRRGVQTALVRHRLRLAAVAGCDVVGVTASVGSTSARVLQRCGAVLVEDQWVVQRG
ncbi:GNAT family N-acetyltransferase [Aquipuribacter hungaricus]|uniref:GNAT family N-acetyltransferase n=1 Tax=Aquipuribacter hungaricus TaxID=545624 RepID=A0ABV7WKQ2_9MICO